MLQQANGKPLIRYAFILYAVMVAWLLLGRSRFDIGRDYWEQVSLNLNLVPFETVRRYLVVILHRTNPYMLPHALMNVLGNLAFFMPFGFLAPWLWKKMRHLGRFMLCTVSMVMAVELIQLFTLRGSGDIDDLILNMAGAAIGFAVFQIIQKKTRWSRYVL